MTMDVRNVFYHPTSLEARAAQAMVDYASGKTTAIHAVIEYGKALLEGRKDRNDKQFGEWIAVNKLNVGKPWNEQQERTAAMNIAKLSQGKLPWGDCPNTTPTNIMKWHRETYPTAAEPQRKNTGKANTPKTDSNKKSAKKGKKAKQADKAFAALKEMKALGLPITREAIAERAKVGTGTASAAMAMDRTERATKAEIVENEDTALAKAEATFSEKSKLTVADAIRIYKTRQDKVFETKVGEEVRKHIAAADEAMRKENAKLRKDNLAITLLLRQGAIFTADEYKTILRCLHPDNSASTETRARAFDLVKQKEKRLVGAL
jgi:hypothetical protein